MAPSPSRWRFWRLLFVWAIRLVLGWPRVQKQEENRGYREADFDNRNKNFMAKIQNWSWLYPKVAILECEVKWALGSITTNKDNGGDGIPVEVLQILKDDAVKVLHSIRQQIWKTQQWPQDWKRSAFIPIPKKGSAKECSNYHTIALISHASRRRHWHPLQHSWLENPMDGGDW